jgi:hypothetical protein
MYRAVLVNVASTGDGSPVKAYAVPIKCPGSITPTSLPSR